MKLKAIQITVRLSFLILCNMYAYGQVKTTRSNSLLAKKHFLHIGDKIPDTYFLVNNYKEKKVNLSDFKNRLIILDLWGTYCGSCIEYMPEIEKLQAQFKDSIRVIMVTKNSDDEVKKCAIRAENVRNNHLPFINGKENLGGFFDLSFVPQYVWIDGSGVIKYISEESGVTPKNIRNFLAGQELNFKIKATIPVANAQDPLLVQMYPYLGKDFYIYSYLAPLDLNKYTTGSFERNGLEMQNPKSLSGNSFNFKNLYKMAYGFSDANNPLSNDRVLIKFNDTANYSDPSKNYIYDLIVNSNVPKTRVLKYMQLQFDLFFNVNSSIRKQSVNCLIIKDLHNGHNSYTAKIDTDDFDIVADSVVKATMSWGKFINYANGIYIVPPYTLIDETGINPKRVVELQMSINFEDLDKVKKSLAPYGLTIDKEERQIDCIVISDLP
jgi:thiol-disulfide isomerase/thioredoxin